MTFFFKEVLNNIIILIKNKASPITFLNRVHKDFLGMLHYYYKIIKSFLFHFFFNSISINFVMSYKYKCFCPWQ